MGYSSESSKKPMQTMQYQEMIGLCLEYPPNLPCRVVSIRRHCRVVFKIFFLWSSSLTHV